MTTAALQDAVRDLERDPVRWAYAFAPDIVSKERFNEETGQLEPWMPRWGAHHVELWEWILTLRRGRTPDPSAFLAVWARGGGKSNNAQMITAYVAGTGVRGFVLYVSGTDKQAKDHARNIQGIIESPAYQAAYPETSLPRTTRSGASQGWRSGRLEADNGFVLECIGIMEAVRGINRMGRRPDMIIFDDIDHLDDGAPMIEKKIHTVTHTILGTRALDCAVLFVQNLIQEFGVMGTIISDRGILRDRKVSGPIPALLNFNPDRDIYEHPESGKYEVVGGDPVWEGQPLESCSAYINDNGLQAFLREHQHLVGSDSTLVHPTFHRMRHGIARSTIDPDAEFEFAGGIDFGGEGYGANPAACILAGQVTSPNAVGLGQGQLVFFEEWRYAGPEVLMKQAEWMTAAEARVGHPIIWAADRTSPEAINTLKRMGFNMIRSLGSENQGLESRARLVGDRLSPRGDGRPGLLFVTGSMDMWCMEMEHYRRLPPAIGSPSDRRPIYRKDDHLVNAGQYVVEYFDRQKRNSEVKPKMRIRW